MRFSCQLDLMRGKDLRIIVHFKDLQESPNKVDLYINCDKMDTKDSNIPLREGLLGEQRTVST